MKEERRKLRKEKAGNFERRMNEILKERRTFCKKKEGNIERRKKPLRRRKKC